MFRNLNTRGKSNNLPIRWGLRRKILVSMIALILLLGLAIVLATHTILLKVLKTEFQHTGLSSARSIVANSLVDVLTQNAGRLKKLIENEKKLDPNVAYIFIVDSSGRVLAHTFSKGFPVNLLGVNTLSENKTEKIQLLDTQIGRIYDIASPILLEKSILGQVRLGIMQKGIQGAIAKVNFILFAITLLVMFIGVALVYKISSLITKPISKLVEATQAIQRGDLSAKIEISTKDEIELLASAFNEMVSHLNLMVEEKKRLTVAKERDRIAIDFHDGCAQELANIIKRIELIHKLFKINPDQAEEELNVLRETTKDTLNRARQVIFDLKSSEDNDLGLFQRLILFIKEFERTNNIAVKSDVSESVNTMPHAQARSIFYIIREAFANIGKHSLAKNVALKLEATGNNLKITIKDDGEGFDINDTKENAPGRQTWGLASMRQRAASLGGTLLINSKPGQGTEVLIDIPLKEELV